MIMTPASFAALPLAEPIQRALAEKGYHTPSPIQEKAIPLALAGGDLLACAQTGTGKTAAFALPILHRLAVECRKPYRREIRALILTPTRELAVQVADSFRAYGANQRLSIGLIYGGVSQQPQVKGLHRGLDVAVATPGRLIDLIDQGHVDLSEVKTFVLDEADRMLDMGFIKDIRRIASYLSSERQTLFFSATMAAEVEQLAGSLLKEPTEIRMAPQGTTAENVDQQVLFVEQGNKQALLFDLLGERDRSQPGQLSLVFSRTKHGANKLAEKLNKAGFRADAIHGNKTQAARQKALDRFRRGEMPVLVATDVAARGIDVKNITLVVNYDLPMEPDGYVHRIGRTARAGESGRALSFCSGTDVSLLRSVERLINQPVPVFSDHAYHAESIALTHQRGKNGSGESRSQGKCRHGGGKRYEKFRGRRNNRRG